MFYLGSLWHGGGANQTGRPRLGVILEYAAGWLRQQENHCLAVRAAPSGSSLKGCRSCSAITFTRHSWVTWMAVIRERSCPPTNS